jgi:AraC family transcriptional activator of pobA
VAARQTRAGATADGGSARQAALHTRFLALVEAHHLDHWPVQRYAERLGTSTDRLNRVTRAHAGRSALDLIHDRLQREACRRLTYLVAPVSKLAFELGFDDPAYFCRFFKRRVGVSPSAFRARSLALA